ncbi:MAG TPA: hypothetical protein VMH39_14045 [Gemmatimonadaceae bacterium]|nr:hypothetical protein [Gemmatimonadaceae bacterium]
MSISGIGAAGGSQAALIALLQQQRDDFQSLVSSVQSGDLSDAQKALAALQQDTGNVAPTSGPSDAGITQSTSTAKSPQTTFTSDFASLVNAVQGGDITAAQSALSALENDVQTASSGYATPATGVQADLQSLFQAVKTGNLSAAQTALTQLQSDSQTRAAGTAGTGAPVGHRHHHHHGGGRVPTASTNATLAAPSSTGTDSGTDSVTAS